MSSPQIVAGNLMVGAAKIYTAAEITDANKATIEDSIFAGSLPVFNPAIHTYQGLTDGGVNASLQKSYANHTVDQSPDWVASTPTERHAQVQTSLAQVTLDKFAIANNGGAITTGVGTGGWQKWEPITNTVDTPETYISVFLYGKRLDGKPCVVAIRRTLSVDNMDFAFAKDAKTMLSVSWGGHFVSDTLAPFAVYQRP